MLRFRLLPAPAGALLLALAAACADREGPVAPAPPAATQPHLARLACTATVAARTVTCTGAEPGGGARGVIVGGQGTYVQLTSSDVGYTALTEILQFSVTVQNLIPQPMGTADGSTPAATGVRVFFTAPPSTTVGSGAVTVANEDGKATFTAGGQDYFQYSGAQLGGDGILSTGETTAAKSWQLHVPATALTFTFSLYVAADVPFPNGYVDVSPAADSLLEGGTQALTATVRTVVGTVVPGAPVTWATSDAGVVTVDASGVATAVSAGSGTVTATSGARSGSAAIAVCPSLGVGGVRTFEMPAGAGLCLGGGGAGAEYTVVPVNTDTLAPIGLGVTASGITPVSGAPSPVILPRRPGRSSARRPAVLPRGDDAFEMRLQERMRRELAGKPAGARSADTGGRGGFFRVAAGGRRVIVPGIPAVGDLMSINVETADACATFDLRTGRVSAVGPFVIVMADTMNPAGGLTQADYQAVADSFQLFVHDVLLGNFGEPSDIDGNGRMIVFYTRAVNELTPAASAPVPGFFLARDLYATTSCPTSNQGEILYLPAADPAGTVNGNVRSVVSIFETTFAEMAHGAEHLINASRRMHVNTPWNGEFEEAWLDEGLADETGELLFYARTGLTPAANLDLADLGDGGTVETMYFRYADANFARLYTWLTAPHARGPFVAGAPDSASRGAAWAYLRYLADHTVGAQTSFWGGLVNTRERGIANLRTALLDADPLPTFRDFAAALYADDAAGSPPAAYTLPSWNYRDVYAGLDFEPGPVCSCAFPLAVRNPANGVQDGFTLEPGGAAAYLRMKVAASGFAGVTVRSGGVAPAATVRLAVIRRN